MYVGEAQGVVQLLEPLNVTVAEGEDARFQCSYTGGDMIVWIINDFYYSELPVKHRLDENRHNVLIISDVHLSMNGNSYRCYAERMISLNTGHLYVIPREGSGVGRRFGKRVLLCLRLDYTKTLIYIMYTVCILLRKFHGCTSTRCTHAPYASGRLLVLT